MACLNAYGLAINRSFAGLQYDSAMQGQAQAAAAQGMALRYVGSLDLVKRRCSVELKVMKSAVPGSAFTHMLGVGSHFLL